MNVPTRPAPRIAQPEPGKNSSCICNPTPATRSCPNPWSWRDSGSCGGCGRDGFWVLGFGFWVLSSGFWALGYQSKHVLGVWSLEFGVWSLEFDQLKTPNPKPKTETRFTTPSPSSLSSP